MRRVRSTPKRVTSIVTILRNPTVTDPSEPPSRGRSGNMGFQKLGVLNTRESYYLGLKIRGLNAGSTSLSPPVQIGPGPCAGTHRALRNGVAWDPL